MKTNNRKFYDSFERKAAFNRVVRLLRKNGFTVITKEIVGIDDEYLFGEAQNSNVVAAFTTSSRYAYASLQNRIAADNKKCFEKWSRCPLVMKFPINAHRLLADLKLLGSEEGLKISKSYSYLDYNPFTYEI